MDFWLASQRLLRERERELERKSIGSRDHTDCDEIGVAVADSLDDGSSLCAQTKIMNCILHITTCKDHHHLHHNHYRCLSLTSYYGTVPTEQGGANWKVTVLRVSLLSSFSRFSQQISSLRVVHY